MDDEAEEEGVLEDFEEADAAVVEEVVDGGDGEAGLVDVGEEAGEGDGGSLEDGGAVDGMVDDAFGDEVDDEEGAVGFEDAMHFGEEGVFVFGVAGGFEGEGVVEGVVGEGGVEEGALDEVGVGEVFVVLALGGEGDFVGGEGEAGEGAVWVLGGEVEGGGADAAAGVEDGGVGLVGEVEGFADEGVHVGPGLSGGFVAGFAVAEVPADLEFFAAGGHVWVGPDHVVVVLEGLFVGGGGVGLGWFFGGVGHPVVWGMGGGLIIVLSVFSRGFAGVFMKGRWRGGDMEDGVFACPECSRDFECEESLLRHRREHRGG